MEFSEEKIAGEIPCPKCGFEQPEAKAECLRCGVIFSKVRAPRESRSEPEPVPYEPPPSVTSPPRLADLPATPVRDDLPGLYRPPDPSTLPDLYEPPPEGVPVVTVTSSRPSEPEQAGRRWLGPVRIGFVLALVVTAIPFTRFVLSYLGVLVHELGHTALAWLFGYPAIPAFDFTYGGGVSLSFDRSTGVVALLLAAWAGLLWFYRAFPRMLALLGTLFATWALLAVTPLHEVLTIAMGHGFELLFAGIFLYRAATGSACKMPEVERPLYGMVGWFLVLEQSRFAWGLVTDPEQRRLYADAKGGGHWMDFSRLARDYLGTSLEVVAGAFLVACLLTPVATRLWVRHREPLWERIEPWLAGARRAGEPNG